MGGEGVITMFVCASLGEGVPLTYFYMGGIIKGGGIGNLRENIAKIG